MVLDLLIMLGYPSALICAFQIYSGDQWELSVRSNYPPLKFSQIINLRYLNYQKIKKKNPLLCILSISQVFFTTKFVSIRFLVNLFHVNFRVNQIILMFQLSRNTVKYSHQGERFLDGHFLKKSKLSYDYFQHSQGKVIFVKKNL